MATIEDILAIDDPTSFAIALSDLVFPRWDRDGYEALTPPERVAYCIDALEREVNNGGFQQFFANSSGDTAADTLSALEALGAAATADLLRRAIGVFPDARPPVDREQRIDLLEQLPADAAATWSRLDDEFYRYPDDLPALLRQYVAEHRAGFRRS